MKRRRLIIEWLDDGIDSDKDCAKAFIAGDWTFEDLVELEKGDDETELRVWVEDAPNGLS
jgi:hypothetical protein